MYHVCAVCDVLDMPTHIYNIYALEAWSLGPVLEYLPLACLDCTALLTPDVCCFFQAQIIVENGHEKLSLSRGGDSLNEGY